MQRVTNAIRRSAVVVTIVGLAALGLGPVAQAATTDPATPDGKEQSVPAGPPTNWTP